MRQKTKSDKEKPTHPAKDGWAISFKSDQKLKLMRA